jgi:hypothetical protein
MRAAERAPECRVKVRLHPSRCLAPRAHSLACASGLALRFSHGRASQHGDADLGKAEAMTTPLRLTHGCIRRRCLVGLCAFVSLAACDQRDEDSTTATASASASGVDGGDSSWGTEGKPVVECREVRNLADCETTESPTGNPCKLFEVRHVNVADCSPVGATGTASLCLESVIGLSIAGGCASMDPGNTQVFYELNEDGTAYLLFKTMCGGSGDESQGCCRVLDHVGLGPQLRPWPALGSYASKD